MAWTGVKQSVVRPHRMAMVASTTAWHYSARVTRSLATPLIPSLHIDASEPLDMIVAQLNDFQPEILAAYPSILRQRAGEALAGWEHDVIRWRRRLIPVQRRRHSRTATRMPSVSVVPSGFMTVPL